MKEEGCGSPLCTLHLTWRKLGLPEWGYPPESLKEVRHFQGGHAIVTHNVDFPGTIMLCGVIRRPAED